MTVLIRVQLRRARGWRKPANTIVVARPSKWGNPYVIHGTQRHIDDAIHEVPDRATAVRLFREWWNWRLQRDPRNATALLTGLRGKNLACWCPLDEPCHADVLLELANR